MGPTNGTPTRDDEDYHTYRESEAPITDTAVAMLEEAAACIGDRASERDTDSERSMRATVDAFNAMYSMSLTEEHGWMFMVFLKAARAKGGDYRKDDYVDGSAYFALAGESRNE